MCVCVISWLPLDSLSSYLYALLGQTKTVQGVHVFFDAFRHHDVSLIPFASIVSGPIVDQLVWYMSVCISMCPGSNF